MSLLDDEKNKQFMDEIKANIKEIVPFLGAGASMPYGCPSWSDLILNVLNSIYSLGEMKDEVNSKIHDLVNNKRYMDAIEEIQKYWPNLENYVCEIISPFKLNDSTPCLGKFIHLFPSQLYLTTNYDTILEEILRMLRTKVDVIFPTSSTTSNVGLKSDGKSAVLCYLHGICTEPNSIVFSNSDYNDFYGRPEDVSNIKSISRRPIVKKLQEVYFRNPILFIGCGMNVKEDRILTLLKRFNKIGQQPENFSYALLDYAGLSQEQISAKAVELTSIRVRPIWYTSEKDILAHEKAKKELFEYILEVQYKQFIDFIRNQEEEGKKRKEVYEAVEKIRQSIKKDVEGKTEIIRTYKYQQKYYTSEHHYEFTLLKSKVTNKYYLSDQGITYKILDNIFVLKEPDVQKNLNHIGNECEVYIIDGQLLIPLEAQTINGEKKIFSEEIESAKCRLFSCVSFMDKMRIFYV